MVEFSGLNEPFIIPFGEDIRVHVKPEGKGWLMRLYEETTPVSSWVYARRPTDIMTKRQFKLWRQLLQSEKDLNDLVATIQNRIAEIATVTKEEIKTVKISREQEERALRLSKDPNLLNIIRVLIRKRIIGEDETALTTFSNIVSGQTRYPQSEILEGESASGKNQTIRAIKPLVPPGWIYEFTIATPEAPKYIPEDFAGTLIIYEVVGIRSQTGTLALRAIGEGENIETIYPMRDEESGRMVLARHKTNAKNFISTTTSLEIDPELETRTARCSMNESSELTRKVIEKKIEEAWIPRRLKELLGEEETANGYTEEDVQSLLRLLDLKAHVQVYIPVTIEQMRKLNVRLRRDIDKIISYAQIVALLHQNQRPYYKIDDEKFIIALPRDIELAWSFCSTSMMETMSRLGKRLTIALEALHSNDYEEFVTTSMFSEWIGRSQDTARVILNQLVKLGYAKKNRDETGRSYSVLSSGRKAQTKPSF